MKEIKKLEVDERVVDVTRDEGRDSTRTKRVKWSAEEREALKTVFRTATKCHGKKPPIGYISTVLKDKRDTPTAKLLIEKDGLTAKKIQDNVLRLLSKN
uniref:Uncharacterized protein n=1 Tax=Amphimedon queenslandica TaxID=400682 RepID=A0A1X7TLW3_AMPQE